jgi:hypothetical protein
MKICIIDNCDEIMNLDINTGDIIDVYSNVDQEFSKDGKTIKPISNIYVDFVRMRPKYDYVILNKMVYNFNIVFVALIIRFGVTDKVLIYSNDNLLKKKNGQITTVTPDMYDELLLHHDIVKNITLNDNDINEYIKKIKGEF